MSTKKVLYFLDMLRRSAQDHGAELEQLQDRAVKEDPEVQRLQSCLSQNCLFFRETGRSLLRRGSALLDRIYTHPDQAAELLEEIRQTNETIQREADLSRELLCAPDFNEQAAVTVMRKEDYEAGIQALRQIAAVSAHLLAVYQGPEALQDLSWNDAGEIQDHLRAVNTLFLPKLWRMFPPQYGWIISRQRLGGGMLVDGCGFSISYEPLLSGGMPYASQWQIPLGSHAYFDPVVWEAEQTDVPCCWGVGCLVSGAPADGLKLLQGGLAVKPRLPRSEETREALPGPAECLERLTDGRTFCVSPEELFTALNQWQSGHEIQERRGKGLCLICGKPVAGRRLACSEHFTSELN